MKDKTKRILIFSGLIIFSIVAAIVFYLAFSSDSYSPITADDYTTKTPNVPDYVEPEKPREEKPKTQPNVAKILEQENAERAKIGLAPLQLHDGLVKSSRDKLDDMIANNYYAHANPSTGMQGYTYIRNETGSLCSVAGENLATSDSNSKPEWIATNWLQSDKGHREAILSPAAVYTGISWGKSYESSDRDDYIIVQHFCEIK